MFVRLKDLLMFDAGLKSSQEALARHEDIKELRRVMGWGGVGWGYFVVFPVHKVIVQ